MHSCALFVCAAVRLGVVCCKDGRTQFVYIGAGCCASVLAVACCRYGCQSAKGHWSSAAQVIVCWWAVR